MDHPFLEWTIGDIRICAVVESVTTAISRFVLPQATPDALSEIDPNRSWLTPYLDPDDQLLMTIQSFLVDTGSHKLLVDTCVGNDKPRRFREWNELQTDYLHRLERAGASPEDIDLVLCTHLHIDHVGWNTRLEAGRWVPTFERAKYLFSHSEWDYWKDREGEVDPIIDDSVRPIVEANLHQLVQGDETIAPGVELVPTPGHTPGHVSVLLRSQGAQAFITGDMVHHPCQLARPDWAAEPDVDKKRSTRTRHDIFERFADQPTLILGSHFHAPTAGHIVRDADRYRFEA